MNSVNWNDYANRAFTFVEGPFIIAPLAEDDIKEDPNLAFELIIHKEINSSRSAYRCVVTQEGLAQGVVVAVSVIQRSNCSIGLIFVFRKYMSSNNHLGVNM